MGSGAVLHDLLPLADGSVGEGGDDNMDGMHTHVVAGDVGAVLGAGAPPQGEANALGPHGLNAENRRIALAFVRSGPSLG